MSSKINPTQIIRAHYGTFTDVNDKPLLRDWASMLGGPVVLAAAAVAIRLQLRQVATVIAGISILTGLLFGLLVYVFSLRLQLAADPRIDAKNRSVKLVTQLFANVAYAVFFGLCTTVYVIAAANAASTVSGLSYLTRWWTGAVVFAAAHLFLTILMCLKRITTAFGELQKPTTRAAASQPDPSEPRQAEEQTFPR